MHLTRPYQVILLYFLKTISVSVLFIAKKSLLFFIAQTLGYMHQWWLETFALQKCYESSGKGIQRCLGKRILVQPVLAARQPPSSKYCNQASVHINSHNPHEKDPDKNKITWECVFLHSYSCIPSSFNIKVTKGEEDTVSTCLLQGSPRTFTWYKQALLQHSFLMNATQLTSRSFGRKFPWYLIIFGVWPTRV